MVGFRESAICGNTVALPQGISDLLGKTAKLYACRSYAGPYGIIELYPTDIFKGGADDIYELRRKRGERDRKIIIGDDDCAFLGERTDGDVVFCGALDHIELWGACSWMLYWEDHGAA